MCGIAGLWRFSASREEELLARARSMAELLAHRGPDGDGFWVDPEAGIALGHRRLAIVDLSPTGHQPMLSADGRIVLTYNGELYNTREIADELAMPFRGTSDTEVLVEAIARFGVEGALRRANGLFAFAAFDRSSRTLHLARDRLGIKPLYWIRQGSTFAFSSELNPLRALSEVRLELDMESVTSYLRHGCVPAPRAIYRDVVKVPPGYRVEVRANGIESHCYWDLLSIGQAQQRNLDRRPEVEVVDELDELLSDAVRRQMVSDVPLGAFLSGGIDSSLVVSMMSKAASAPVKTFSIGFNETAYNEANDARAVAAHLGTDHTELTLSGADARAIVPMLPGIYDEPFADSSQIPTFLVSRLARQKVTVALSGDGGDEAFGGYVRYRGLQRLQRSAGALPRALRTGLAGAIRLLSPDAWEAVAGPIPRRFKPSRLGSKISRAADLLEADNLQEMYRRLMGQWPDPARLMRGRKEPLGWADRLPVNSTDLDTVSELRLLEMMNYLPDDLLTKVDRASMAVSLEVRVPLLDHRVVEFACRLPSETLIRNGKGKRPLRAVLNRYVPRNLVDRPKMGFSVPIGKWLRGPLREWAEGILFSNSIAHDGIFDVSLLRERFAEHVSTRRNWDHALWTVLQFQSWRQRFC